MKIPEPLFKLINLVVIGLLKSPLHGLVSKSLMVIRFTGRKTGRIYTTPVRYLLSDQRVQCFTSKSTGWWRNLVAAPGVSLLIEGSWRDFVPEVAVDDPEKIIPALRQCLALYPADAAYHNIRIIDGEIDVESFDAAIPETVLLTLVEKR